MNDEKKRRRPRGAGAGAGGAAVLRVPGGGEGAPGIHEESPARTSRRRRGVRKVRVADPLVG